jgi:hypothetical protein
MLLSSSNFRAAPSALKAAMERLDCISTSTPLSTVAPAIKATTVKNWSVNLVLNPKI